MGAPPVKGQRKAAAGTVVAMTVPLDEGEERRRRVGPFWIEEGLGLVAVGAAVLGLFVALFVLAVIFRPA